MVPTTHPHSLLIFSDSHTFHGCFRFYILMGIHLVNISQDAWGGTCVTSYRANTKISIGIFIFYFFCLGLCVGTGREKLDEGHRVTWVQITHVKPG